MEIHRYTNAKLMGLKRGSNLDF